MTDVAEKPRFSWRKAILVRLQWTWIFLTWYVLSIGPMYWAWYHSTVNSEPSWVETFYRPLAYACDWCPPLGWLVNAYVELWVL